MSTVEHAFAVHDADMNDRDGSARAEDALYDASKVGVLVVHLFQDLEDVTSISVSRTRPEPTSH